MSVHRIPSYEKRRPEESVLYKTLASNLNTFLRNLSEEGKRLPAHVEKELWAYLECGVLAYGFMRLSCDDCGSEKLVAFSCKKRGFCPSCGCKKMSETAYHLVENIIPKVPIRQYVLSIPYPLRYWLASSKELTGKVHKILARAVEEFYCDPNKKKTRSGAITFIQRFGGALNLNVHFHMLQIEGFYQEKSTGDHKFIRTPAPKDNDIQELVELIQERVIRLLLRTGYLSKEEDTPHTPNDPLYKEEETYASCMSASVQSRIALGERRGKNVRFIGPGFGYEGERAQIKSHLCAHVGGFSLHAGVSIKPHRREDLERLISYTARPAISTERMSLTESGNIKYKLKKAWSTGKTHVLLSPHELIEKLCALVPLPRMHLVRYSGVLAPNAKMRKGIIPGKTRAQIKAEQEEKNKDEKPTLLQKSSWAKLLAKVFEIDISKCSCGGNLKIISVIRDPFAIRKILSHLGLSPQPPPIAPARYQEDIFIS